MFIIPFGSVWATFQPISTQLEPFGDISSVPLVSNVSAVARPQILLLQDHRAALCGAETSSVCRSEICCGSAAATWCGVCSQDICCVCSEDICIVSSQDICIVSSQGICIEDICILSHLDATNHNMRAAQPRVCRSSYY